MSHGEGDATLSQVVLAAVPAVGEVVSEGLALRLRGGGEVAGIRLDRGKDGPTRPRLGRMAERRLAFDRAADLLPSFIETAELSE